MIVLEPAGRPARRRSKATFGPDGGTLAVRYEDGEVQHRNVADQGSAQRVHHAWTPYDLVHSDTVGSLGCRER